MFKVNDYVVYGLNGVCQIADIRKDNYDNSNETEYYILKPVFNTSMTSIMVPVNNSNTMMRAISTKNDVLSLIAKMPYIETTCWIDNDMQRTNQYKAALRSGKTEEWVKIIKTLYQEKQARSSVGRKLATTDEGLLNTAEKHLNEEFSIALNISPDEVPSYIHEHIS
ncbi:MAG: CarD family transcriptional regulator [Syntrophomonas sp.]